MICCSRTRSGSCRTTRRSKPERAMAPETILAWQKLYGAVAVLAAVCSACAALKTCYDIRTACSGRRRSLQWGGSFGCRACGCTSNLRTSSDFRAFWRSRCSMHAISGLQRSYLHRPIDRPPDSLTLLSLDRRRWLWLWYPSQWALRWQASPSS